MFWDTEEIILISQVVFVTSLFIDAWQTLAVFPQVLIVEHLYLAYGSVPVDFLRPKFRFVHTKDDVISILMHRYTYTNMYIIKKIISCRFILCWEITSLFKPYEKNCWRRKVKIEKILTVTYHTLLTKTTNFLGDIWGYKICLYLKIISYSNNIKLIQGFNVSFWRNRQDRMRNRFYASFRIAANAKCTP